MKLTLLLEIDEQLQKLKRRFLADPNIEDALRLERAFRRLGRHIVRSKRFGASGEVKGFSPAWGDRATLVMVQWDARDSLSRPITAGEDFNDLKGDDDYMMIIKFILDQNEHRFI